MASNDAQNAPMPHPTPDLVVITGMSGAGRTEAMHTFEDMNYFCIDNLPPALLMSLVSSDSIPSQDGASGKLAVVCDARNRNYFRELTRELARLSEAGIDYSIIFLDASDEAILARYKASRRRHPMCVDNKTTISQGIAMERELTQELRATADAIIDTSNMRPIVLRERIRSLFAHETPRQGMSVVVYSFGFKHGSAADADILIDVRFLPNPYYDPEMRHLTGLDDKVRTFVMERSETKEFMVRWTALLDCVMPGYVAEGKQQLAIGVGCTGGQHRSVAIAVATGEYLRKCGYQVHVSHRDLSRADTGEAKKAGEGE